MKNLSFLRTDPGFCRIYYRDSENSLYCFQVSWGKNFELFLCTKDGEPSHRVPLLRTLDMLPPAACPLTTSFSAWVADQEHICLLQ